MTNPQPNPVRTLESHGVIDQTTDEWHQKKACNAALIGELHHMVSVKTNSELVPYVERCENCGWVDGASLNWWAENAIKNQLNERAKRMALAADQDPFRFVQSSHEDLDLSEVLGQALGAASTCWSEKTLFMVGEFDGSRARAVFEALLREVQRFARLDAEVERTRILNIVAAVSRSGSATPIQDILSMEREDRNPVDLSSPSGGPVSVPVPTNSPEV